MVDGLLFCARLTGRRGGHTPFVQAGAESSSDELAVPSCPLLCLQGQVAKLASGLFYCWSLLCNNNMATNLLMFTSSYRDC